MQLVKEPDQVSQRPSPDHVRLNGAGTNGQLSRVKPRICLPTFRKFNKMAARCGPYEAEDVLVAADHVDTVVMEPGWQFESRQKIVKSLAFRSRCSSFASLNPGLRPIWLDRHYDVFITRCVLLWDLLYLNSIQNWKQKCSVSICWLDEIWANLVPRHTHILQILKRFDYVVVGCRDSVDAISKLLGRQCHHVAFGVDALRFSPYPNPPSRCIDVYSLGRKWDGLHGALQRMADRKEIFYTFDTSLRGGAQTVTSHQEHRELIANTAKRSRFFIVAPAKMNAGGETQGQVEVGARYYEGAASGAVMLGQAPDCELFRRMFDWPDAVVEVASDGSDVMEVLTQLSNRPELTTEMGRRNAIEALLRHDWVFRWKQIFEIAGLKPTTAMGEREKQLRELAVRAGSGVPA